MFQQLKQKIQNQIQAQEKHRAIDEGGGMLRWSEVRPLIQQLKLLVGVTQADFQSLYIQFVQRIIEFLTPPNVDIDHQQIINSLTKAVEALKRRRGYLLPLGADSETCYREREVWTYAIFTAVLLTSFEPSNKTDIAKALISSVAYSWLHRHAGLFAVWTDCLDKSDTKDNVIAVIINGDACEESELQKTTKATEDVKKEKIINVDAVVSNMELTPNTNLISEDISCEDNADIKVKQPEHNHAEVAAQEANKSVGFIEEIDLNHVNEKVVVKYDMANDITGDERKPKKVTLPNCGIQAFIDWLVSVMKERSISINEKESVVHIVDDGVLLIIPAIIDAFFKSKLRDIDLPDMTITLKQQVQLTKAIKKSEFIKRRADESAIQSYYWGEWQDRLLYSGVVVPFGILLLDNKTSETNLHLHKEINL